MAIVYFEIVCVVVIDPVQMKPLVEYTVTAK